MVKLLALALCCLALTTACATPRGDTPAEQIANALAMRDEALAAMYRDDPDLEQRVEKAAGYAVFSNFSIHPGLLSFARGYGVFTDNATGKVTHAKWNRLTLGPGIAVKGLYGLLILHDRELAARFEQGRWTAMGQVEASFVFGDFGGALEYAWVFDNEADVHYLTHTGVALELELIGFGHVSSNSELNRAATP